MRLVFGHESEGDGREDAEEGGDVVPRGPGLEIDHGENDEDGKGDDFLDDF